jgi:hypothetical protein
MLGNQYIVVSQKKTQHNDMHPVVCPATADRRNAAMRSFKPFMARPATADLYSKRQKNVKAEIPAYG